MSVQVSPQKPSVGAATVTVKLTDADGRPIRGADVRVEGDMSHAGMVPVVVEAVPAGDGVYKTGNFKFTMGGDWILIVTAKLPDGTELKKQVKVSGVSGRMHMGK